MLSNLNKLKQHCKEEWVNTLPQPCEKLIVTQEMITLS